MIAVGAGKARDLKVPGRNLKGIHQAMEYLTQSNLVVDGVLDKSEAIWAENKDVLVIGGGDTGSDCVGTARRQRARMIYQFEIMPEPIAWDKPWNPQWPHRPNILHTSTSHREGCERRWNVSTVAFSGQNGTLQKAHCRVVKWQGIPLKPLPVKGSEFDVHVDLVFLAMGFLGIRHGRLIEDLRLEVDEKGNIKTDDDFRTSDPTVYAVGDAVNGASLVVNAIQSGRKAAEAIEKLIG